MRASADWRILKMPMELYLVSRRTRLLTIEGWLTPTQLSLFVADLIHGFGASLSLKWVLEGKVRTGTYCNVQGHDIFNSCTDY